jgi:hypothetical protein
MNIAPAQKSSWFLMLSFTVSPRLPARDCQAGVIGDRPSSREAGRRLPFVRSLAGPSAKQKN